MGKYDTEIKGRRCTIDELARQNKKLLQEIDILWSDADRRHDLRTLSVGDRASAISQIRQRRKTIEENNRRIDAIMMEIEQYIVGGWGVVQ